MTPMNDSVLIRRLPEPTKSRGGILIARIGPDNSGIGTCHAKVLAVGPGRRSSTGHRLPIGVEVGDLVLVVKNGCIDRAIVDDLGINRDETYLIDRQFILARGKDILKCD